MSDFNRSQPIAPLFLSTMTQPFCGLEARAFAGLSPASGAWPLALYVSYVPFWIPFQYPVRRVWWQNGSATTVNIDVGVYSTDGTRLFSSGSTASSGTTAPQYVSLTTEYLLDPGCYYFAQVADNTSVNRVNRSTALSVAQQRLIGHLGQTLGAMPLPATATFAASSQIVYPICGVTQTSSGF